MGIRSLLRKVFGRDRDQTDSPATSVPPQSRELPEPTPEPSRETPDTPDTPEAEARRAADDLVSKSFDNPQIPKARTETPPAATEPTTEDATPQTVADPAAPQAPAEATDADPAAEATEPEALAEPAAPQEPASEEPEAPAEAPQAADDAAAEPEAPTSAPTRTAQADEPAPGTEASAETAPEPAAETLDTTAPQAADDAATADAEPEAEAPEAEPQAADDDIEPTAEAEAESSAEATGENAPQAADDAATAAADAQPEAEDAAPQAEPAAEAEDAAPQEQAAAVEAEAPEAAEPEAQAPQATEPEAAGSAVAVARVRKDAPQLVEAYKAAGSVLKKQGLTGARAAVYLVVDRSGSMRGYFKDGSVQRLAEQTVALAAHLDEAATVTTVFFSTDVDGTLELTPATTSPTRVEEINGTLGRLGRTNYHRAVEEVLAHHEKADPTRPALVVFQTDGAPESKTAATQALAEAAGRPLHWRFVAWGEEDNKAFDYLRKLEAPRTATYFAGPTPSETAHPAFFRALLAGLTDI